VSLRKRWSAGVGDGLSAELMASVRFIVQLVTFSSIYIVLVTSNYSTSRVIASLKVVG
jgi:hypothetical protein